jgi:hypothetical protein
MSDFLEDPLTWSKFIYTLRLDLLEKYYACCLDPIHHLVGDEVIRLISSYAVDIVGILVYVEREGMVGEVAEVNQRADG